MLLESEFMKAVQENKTEDVKNFLKNPDLNINYLHDPKNSNPNPNLPVPVSALHVAVLKGRTEIVKLLLEEEKFNQDAVTNTNRTALHLAAGLGQVEICELLITKVNCAIKDKTGKTAYDVAKNYTNAVDLEKRKKYEKIAELLKDPTLVSACGEGDLELVKKMLEVEKANTNALNLRVHTLNTTSFRTNYSLFKYLQSQPKIDAKVVELLKGLNFITACRDDNLELVKNMVEAEKVNINALYFGVHALSTACFQANYSVFKYLMSQSGIDVKVKDDEGFTPLHILLHPKTKTIQAKVTDQFNRRQMAQELVLKGADVNARSKTYGATPLLHAVLIDANLVVQYLLNKDADLSFVYPKNNEEGETKFWTADIFVFARNEKHDPKILDLLNKAKQEREDFNVAKKLVANSKGFQFSSDSASVTYSMENNNHATYELKI